MTAEMLDNRNRLAAFLSSLAKGMAMSKRKVEITANKAEILNTNSNTENCSGVKSLVRTGDNKKGKT